MRSPLFNNNGFNVSVSSQLSYSWLWSCLGADQVLPSSLLLLTNALWSEESNASPIEKIASKSLFGKRLTPGNIPCLLTRRGSGFW